MERIAQDAGQVLEGGDAADRARVVAECWAEATGAEERWRSLVGTIDRPLQAAYRAEWLAMDRAAGVSSQPE